MALDVTKYRDDLKAAAIADKAALIAKSANDPARKTRVTELQAKWDGLKSQEAEIGRNLADDPNFKADGSLLQQIVDLKTKVQAELSTFGVVVS